MNRQMNSRDITEAHNDFNAAWKELMTTYLSDDLSLKPALLLFLTPRTHSVLLEKFIQDCGNRLVNAQPAQPAQPAQRAQRAQQAQQAQRALISNPLNTLGANVLTKSPMARRTKEDADQAIDPGGFELWPADGQNHNQEWLDWYNLSYGMRNVFSHGSPDMTLVRGCLPHDVRQRLRDRLMELSNAGSKGKWQQVEFAYCTLKALRLTEEQANIAGVVSLEDLGTVVRQYVVCDCKDVDAVNVMSRFARLWHPKLLRVLHQVLLESLPRQP